ncbi:MAG TPA: CBS domain-containing protein [Nitrososphaeraceae archaeon]|nr:CBS domain-containing protein [Nitrososphaeraceae archaeon]
MSNQNNIDDDDTLVEDYMTTTTVTMNFKNSVFDIAKKMLAENISSIPITDEEGEIIGILTERDMIKVIANELLPGDISAMSLMSFPTVTVKRKAPIEEAAKIMATKKLRHLIVEDTYNKDVVGVITVTDLARYLKQKSKTGEPPAASEAWEVFF